MRRGTDRGRTRSTVAKWVQKGTGDSVHRQSPIGADRLAEEAVRGKDGSSIGKRNNFQQMSHGSAPKHSEYKPKFVSKNRQEWHSHGGIQEVGADRLAGETVSGEDGSSIGKRNNSQQMSQGIVPKNSEYKPKLGSKTRQEWHSHGGKDGFANIVRSQRGINSPESVGSRSKQFKSMGTPDSAHKQDFPQLSGQSNSEDLDAGRIQSGKILSVGTADSITLQDDLPHQAAPSNEGASLKVDVESKLKTSVHQVETQVLSISTKKYEPSSSKDPKSSAGHKNLEHSEHSAMLDPFDLCPTKSEKTVMLKPPLLVQNRERRNEIKSSLEGQNVIVLRAGMVLLKSYISFSDQVKIVKKCRDLGLGPGGFYQPGYRDGAKLRLKMMCLGKNWDPDTGNYGDHRPVDEAKPPTIPAEFYQLVKKSIEDSHSLIQKNSKSSNVESILPWMSPNICLVNFYSENGRLGLHQDRDESQESLAKGLPVVSFSIGDKADFLYGDQRDVDKAEKVVLESGDVLIFGGKSRHIFHGVTAIHPNSAPKSLLEETKLRPGRLNLTFRQY
ncbi:DNA N(6)-methyladenine demethylase ALKBH1C-like isoform X2 [Castanea sativa]|uniref:DNA N(6)-methyladenine demethylase ALKBH1C-like isoform X2 n=1 Tax=Castanea sativa TaxID=21020 RepID=UPI003F649449